MTTNNSASLKHFLICRSGLRLCGFPLAHVIETMRKLPVETFPDMPPFMAGVSIIRGATVPVVNLAMLLGDATDSDATDSKITRFVSIRLKDRIVAFAVGSVIGTEQLATDAVGTAGELPPLLGKVNSSIVTALSIRDAELFSVLETSHVIPETIWKQLDARGTLP